MSAETQNTPPSSCDALLDYAYGELEGAAKEEFERHLAECEKCKRELEAFGRVRGAARAALPFLDPPASATGALHAQLLHAAAQRKPPRMSATTGKLLSFPRRVMQHPGWLAAASLMVIGGALGLNWSKGHLFMPAPTAERSAAEAAKPVELPATPAATPVVAAAPAGAPVTVEPAPGLTGSTALGKSANTAPVDETLKMDRNGADKDVSKENKVQLALPKQKMPMNVQHADPKAPQFKAKPAKSGYVTGDDADLLLQQPADTFGAVNAAGGAAGAKKESAPAMRGRATEGGQGDVRNYMDGKVMEKSADAPPPPAEKPQMQTATPSRRISAEPQAAPAPKPAPPPAQYQYRPQSPASGAAANAPAPSAPAPTSQAAPAAEMQHEESLAAPQQAVQSTARKHGKKSSVSTRDDNSDAKSLAEDSRKAFLEAVKTNNCDEVIKRYGELTRNTKAAWATPDQEAAFSHCVTQARREQQTVEQAQQLRSKASKKAKQAPAAADAPSQSGPAAASPAKSF